MLYFFTQKVVWKCIRCIFRRPCLRLWGLTFVQFPRQCVADALNQDNEQHENGDDENDDFGLVADEITYVYKQIETAAELHLISLLPEELQVDFLPYLDSQYFSEEEKHIVKQADLICACIKVKFELENGNQEFKSAKVRLENLMEQWHSPEMDYFLHVFVPSFGKSIDEITL